MSREIDALKANFRWRKPKHHPILTLALSDKRMLATKYVCNTHKLLINSVKEAKNCLAGLIEDVSVLSDNPDAGLTKAQVLELASASKALKDLQIPGAGR